MKTATIGGTRPEWIRLSRIVPLLDRLVGRENHQVLHTGQNSSPELDAEVFADVGLRPPDERVESRGTFAEQLATMLPAVEAWLSRFKPDRFLVLGDTNSSTCALVAARLGIPVYHLEAGNRCHGPDSPEEVNRRLIDHVSTVHLCYSERARANLLAEGLPLARTYVVGNPLAEVLDGRDWLMTGLLTWDEHLPGAAHRFLATLHRAENVDPPGRLEAFLDAIQALCASKDTRCLLSTHPRTRARLEGREARWDRIEFARPLPFSRFVALESAASLVLSDSGTAPEECAILRRPLVILRDHMERQEVLEWGTGVLWTDRSPCTLAEAARCALEAPCSGPPPDHEPRPTASTVARLLLSQIPLA